MKLNYTSFSRFFKPAAALALLSALGALPAFGQFGPSASTNVSVSVGAEASIQITASSTPLTAGSGGAFSSYTGTTNFLFKIRTKNSGSITVRFSEFLPNTGPKIGTPASGDALTYDTVIPGGTAYSAQTASTTTDTIVGSFGTDARSVQAGNAGTVTWTLPNDPAYKADTYTANATFTISAT
jgi:hypothetical protein